MDAAQGVLGQVGRCNAKDIPLPDNTRTAADVCQSISTLLVTIHKICTADQLRPNQESNHVPKTQQSISTICQATTNLSKQEIHRIVHDIHNACISENDNTPYCANMESVIQARSMTKGEVITPMDKADSSLIRMCPVAYHAKIVKEMMMCPNLTNITGKQDCKAILTSMKQKYQELRLARRFPPRQGGLPHSYIKPKIKDPIEKNRVITSYSNYPMRKLLQLASKALTFCLRNLSRKHRHFCLHRLNDTKNMIRKFQQRWMKRFGTENRAQVKVVATDLKQMYTYLDHGEIIKAVMWLFEKIQFGSSKDTDVNGRRLRKRKILIKVSTEAPYRASFTSNDAVDSECVIFTLSDLYDIIAFDLENTYTTIGTQIFKQNKGCPMGGLLSSFYGNVTCCYHENAYLNQNRATADHLWGIRQMDDLTLFIVHGPDDDNAQANNERIQAEIQNAVYKGGLEAELQAPDEENQTKYVHKFAGHEIHTHKDLSDVYTTTLNENKQSVREEGRQTKIRYPNMYTYTNNHCKMGNIIGSVHRIRAQNTYLHDFTEAIHDLIAELKCINYSHATIKKCLYKLARQECWSDMLDNNLRMLSRRTAQPMQARTRTTPVKHRKLTRR